MHITNNNKSMEAIVEKYASMMNELEGGAKGKSKVMSKVQRSKLIQTLTDIIKYHDTQHAEHPIVYAPRCPTGTVACDAAAGDCPDAATMTRLSKSKRYAAASKTLTLDRDGNVQMCVPPAALAGVVGEDGWPTEKFNDTMGRLFN